MDKNYYDILQVNKNASDEIIEKAYKTLAKKYHPDLHLDENKKQSEEILKEINEAYEVLSNSEKRQEYDAFLFKQNEQKVSNNQTISTKPSKEDLYLKQQQELAYQKQLQQARQKAYYDAYIQDLKNRGYKIRYKKSFKDYIKAGLTLLLTVAVLFLLWQIPFIQNFFIDLLKQNELFSVLFQ